MTFIKSPSKVYFFPYNFRTAEPKEKKFSGYVCIILNTYWPITEDCSPSEDKVTEAFDLFFEKVNSC